MAVTSMPLSLAFDPDSFYFGLLPILANASHAAGGSSIEVARAAVLGQMTTGFPVSPLTPSTFLLVGLAGVDLVGSSATDDCLRIWHHPDHDGRRGPVSSDWHMKSQRIRNAAVDGLQPVVRPA